MGILGMGPETAKEEFTCPNCGKTVKVGEHFTKEGKEFCCEHCCLRGEKTEEKKKAKTCEFCWKVDQFMQNPLERFFPVKTAYAHCDIPCGIYDPHNAQVAAHTVIRMTSLINDLQPTTPEPEFAERKKIITTLSRYTKVKEEHAELIKHEVRVIWGDYFKAEHKEKFPELDGLVFNIMKLASKSRQEIDLESAQNLLSEVQKFAEIFYKSKSLEPVRIKSTFPTEGEIVIHR